MKKNYFLQSIMIAALSGLAFSPTYAADPGTTDMTAQQNMTQGKTFLEKNKSKKGVVTTPSGLQYEVVVQGNGKKPGPTDIVTVDYEGRLLNGQIFDSSYKRGEPASFPVNGVITGWQEALQLMNTGSTYMLYIPSDLAYGQSGAGGMIGPNELLIFKVHLIGVK